MLGKLLSVVTEERKRDLALTGLGMASLVAGLGPLAAVPFGLGVRGVEKQWRRKHAFTGTFEQRWAHSVKFYEATHQHPVNRALHVIGTPFILAGTAGLAVSSPLNPLSWPVYVPSVTSFVGGWALNLAGHAVFEKNPPAFADDPLGFVAGPMWELDLLRKRVAGASAAPAAGATA